MYSLKNPNHLKRKENGNHKLCINNFFFFIFLTREKVCFYFENYTNAPLIKKSLKVECSVEACRTCRILEKYGWNKIQSCNYYQVFSLFSGKSTQQISSLYYSWSKKERIKPNPSKLSNHTFSFSKLHLDARNTLNLLFVRKM